MPCHPLKAPGRCYSKSQQNCGRFTMREIAQFFRDHVFARLLRDLGAEQRRESLQAFDASAVVVDLTKNVEKLK